MIKILPQELINKIAAGEVVERPASVIKELVENSLDAGAKNITIEVENGGLNLLKVIDDGCGMTPDDAKLSLAQHATSKIATADDLFNISSLGFRGEALASISAVSEFTLTTRPKDNLAGVAVTFANNQLESREIGCNIGTAVEVRNLFYNVPARQKFLKTAITEYNQIVDLFINYILAYQDVGWKLIHNGRVAYQFSATADLKNRIFEVLGKEVSDNLLEINYQGLDINLTGFIGKPQIARNNRKLQYLFVNQRPVNDFILSRQIKEAYGGLLMNNAYPVYLLFLKINPDKVDVNVHPRKLEIRFAEPQKIYSAVYRAVAGVLDQSDLTKQISTSFENQGKRNNFTKSAPSNNNQKFSFPAPNKTIFGGQASAKSFDFNRQMLEPQGTIKEPEPEINFRVIGQVADSYIIIENKQALKIIDQHAASERIQYEKIKREWADKKIIKQPLLLPDNLELTISEAAAVKNKFDVLATFGFEISELSGQTFMINAVPQALASKDYKGALKDLVGKIVEAGEQDLQKESERLEDILKVMACKSAIKFGDKLSNAEMYGLIFQLEDCANQYTCAHGRPCVMEFSFGELEKMFKRKNV